MKRLKSLGWQLASLCVILFAASQYPAWGKEVTYYYTDPQGTVLATTDAQGNILTTSDRKPYGSQALGTPQPGPGYTGHVDDPDSGLIYMQARYYDSMLGRFLSTDPRASEPGNVVALGRYTYGSNNPISNIDPDGREAACVSQASHCGNIGKDIASFPSKVADAVDTINNEVVTPIIAANPAAFGEASVALRGMSTGLRAVSAGEVAAVAVEGSEVPTAISSTEQVTAKLSELRPTHGVTMSNKSLARLTKSIGSEGLQNPLTITRHEGASYILDGNNRAVAAYKAGLKDVPVIEKQLPWGAYSSPSDLIFNP